MKTDELLALLATQAPPGTHESAGRRYATAIGWGTLGATLLMAIFLGVRHDMSVAVTRPMFWVKLAYVAALAGAGVLATMRLSIPGMKLGQLGAALAAPIVAMWLLAALALMPASPPERSQMFWGETWAWCPVLVALLSVPVFVALCWAMRGLAPTRLALAGGMAGFASGALAAVVYSLHCPELGAPFLGFWYLLGILVPTAIGALVGRSLFRW